VIFVDLQYPAVSDICGCSIQPSEISVDLQLSAVCDICGSATSSCLRYLWICNIQLFAISVDLQHPAVCDICGTATSSCIRYLWICNIQLCQISVDAASSRLRYRWMWNIQLSDVCGSATFTCLWNLWISNNHLSSRSVNVYDSFHSWFCEAVAFSFLLILHVLEIFHHLICFNTPSRKLAVVPLSSKIYNNRRQKKSIVCATLIHVKHLFSQNFWSVKTLVDKATVMFMINICCLFL